MPDKRVWGNHLNVARVFPHLQVELHAVVYDQVHKELRKVELILCEYERAFNDLWWLGLVSAILMIGLAFWVSGEFFLGRAFTLLVFAGIWALMKGITDIVRAFQIRQLGSS